LVCKNGDLSSSPKTLVKNKTKTKSKNKQRKKKKEKKKKTDARRWEFQASLGYIADSISKHKKNRITCDVCTSPGPYVHRCTLYDQL
jgi:hypothetical protein